jgi:hypothetical protein
MSRIYRRIIRTRILKSVVLVPFYFVRFVIYSITTRSLWFYRYFPGHYGSTLPSGADIRKHRAKLFNPPGLTNDGVELNTKKQLELLNEFASYHDDFAPDKDASPSRLYYYRNDMYGFADGLVLYCFLRHFKPTKVIEIGSGHSSGLMLDCAKGYLPETHFIFVDPYSTTIADVLSKHSGGNYQLIREPVQEVDLTVYSDMRENDILFIDSSHVLKIGSDLSTILYSILPSLNAGVIVHFHDIIFPFEYYETMLREGRAWNEIYFLRAFLQFNSSFEILFFNSFLEQVHSGEVRGKMPNYFRSGGSSLWLRKTR